MNAPIPQIQLELEAANRQAPLPFDRLYTVREAARATGISYWLLLRAVNNGDIPFYRFGNTRRRVRLPDIEAVVARSMSAA